MHWPRSLLVRLLAPYLIALAAVAVSLYVYTDGVVERLYLDTLADNVRRQAQLVADELPWAPRGDPLDRWCAALSTQVAGRVTVIAGDGTVLGDSDAPAGTLENEADRPEVRTALSDGAGRAVRVAAGAHVPLFYLAVRRVHGAEQRVVRVAVPLPTVDSARQRIRTAIWSGVLVAALAALWPAFALARRLSRRVQRVADFSNAVAAGAEPLPLASEGDDLITQLETNLVAMAGTLRAQLRVAREEKSKLEAVLSGMVEGVLVIGGDGIIRLSNQRADRLFGSPDQTLVGRPLIDVSRDPDLQDLVRSVIRGTFERPAVREVALESVGREILRVTATPIAADGPPLFILVFHDITELKRLEATRRDFVANVSHELRTPLTAIRGYAETLQSGALADAQLAGKFVGVIERHSERLGRLIDDLLNLSDLELGRAELQRAPMPLAPAVDAAIELVREKAARGQVHVQRDLAADVPAVDADADRVEQVLVNLIDNAVKYTSAGGRVVISAHAVRNGGLPAALAEMGGRWVDICVADTGIGVPSQDLPRLTERFYRVDKARSRELGGTGLGLAIVKHIVHAHGGALHIESEVGHGTCVHVYLPAA